MKMPLRFGLIGFKFMGKIHSKALHDVSFLFLKARFKRFQAVLCREEENLPEAVACNGWQRWTHRRREVDADSKIDVDVVATPGNPHCEIAITAAEAGCDVICEKPLALDAKHAARMCKAVERAGVGYLVNFNFPRVPAVQVARRLVEHDRPGKIYPFGGTRGRDWPLEAAFPFEWRCDRAIAGDGSMADKGLHLVHLALYLVGDIVEVAATTEMFVPNRTAPESAAHEVSTCDAAAFLARFRSGAISLFDTSRMSAGHKNARGLEVNGSRASPRFDPERLNGLQTGSVDDDRAAHAFRTILVTESIDRSVDRLWPPSHILGREQTFTYQYCEFLHVLETDTLTSPNLRDGLKVQCVLGVVEQSVAERR